MRKLSAVLFVLAALSPAFVAAEEGTPAVIVSSAPDKASSMPAAPAGPVDAKVISSYMDRGVNKLILESKQPLVSGRNVFVGPNFIPFVLTDILSRNEIYYYYGATTEGKQDVKPGDSVGLEPPKTIGGPTSMLSFQIKEHYTFEQKRVGTVTAVMGDRAMVDKGSLQEVRERDLYRIYDSKGHYKGLIELRGIGDLQSEGKLYNAFEDWHRDALKTAPGDKVVFAGQRKLFGLGLLGSIPDRSEDILGSRETSSGGGLIWNFTLPDGWGAEILFGGYSRSASGSQSTGSNSTSLFYRTLTVKADYLAPVWIKKSFFYPATVSPFLAAGISYFTGKAEFVGFCQDCDPINPSLTFKDKTTTKKFVPVFGGGLEFFSGRFFRPRIEVRYLQGPKITAGHAPFQSPAFATSRLYYGFGFLTSW